MKDWLPDQVYSNEVVAREVIRFLAAQYGAANPSQAPYVLGVCLSASHELIGHVGFSPCEYGVEVGYAIGEVYQNRGYAKQAVSAGISWALSRFGLTSIHAIVATANIGSCSVLQLCGFESLDVIQRKLHGVERTVRIYRFTNASRRDA
jgi:RimJ/RimL family protein N-acetyltransferase